MLNHHGLVCCLNTVVVYWKRRKGVGLRPNLPDVYPETDSEPEEVEQPRQEVGEEILQDCPGVKEETFQELIG